MTLTESIRALVRAEVQHIFGEVLKANSEVGAVVSKGCAIRGCGRPRRCIGYCAAHYQKRRNMQKAGRLPKDWVEDASPGSASEVRLARGRPPAS